MNAAQPQPPPAADAAAGQGNESLHSILDTYIAALGLSGEDVNTSIVLEPGSLRSTPAHSERTSPAQPRANVVLNELPNVYTMYMALGDHVGTMKVPNILYNSPGNFGAVSLLKRYAASTALRMYPPVISYLSEISSRSTPSASTMPAAEGSRRQICSLCSGLEG